MKRDDAAAEDNDDDDDGRPVVESPVTRALTVVLVIALVVAALAVMATFILGLGQQASSVDVSLIVIGDPVPRATPTTVRVVAVGPDRVLPVHGTVNGAAINDDGLVEVVTDSGLLDVVAEVQWRDRPERLDLHCPLSSSTTLSTTFSTTKAPRVLLSPATGPGVYPLDGLVPARGPARVLLLDDDDARVIDVDASVDGRLPDGRLLALDRSPMQASVNALDDVTVTLVARRATTAMMNVVVGGRVLTQQRLTLAATETRVLHLALPPWHQVGDIVVVGIDTTLVPHQGDMSERQLVTRVGGLTDDDLVAVDQRARPFLERAEVRQALARRLRVENGEARIVSPPMAMQRLGRQATRASNAAKARAGFRVASVAMVVLVALSGLWWRGRPTMVVTGVVVVAALLLGLDAMLGVVKDSGDVDLRPAAGATSGSP